MTRRGWQVSSGPEDDEEARPRGGQEETSADLVRSYLRGLGRTPLLSRAEEVVLAKQLEEGRSIMSRALLDYPGAREELRRVGEAIEAGGVRARDLFEIDAE